MENVLHPLGHIIRNICNLIRRWSAALALAPTPRIHGTRSRYSIRKYESFLFQSFHVAWLVCTSDLVQERICVPLK